MLSEYFNPQRGLDKIKESAEDHIRLQSGNKTVETGVDVNSHEMQSEPGDKTDEAGLSVVTETPEVYSNTENCPLRSSTAGQKRDRGAIGTNRRDGLCVYVVLMSINRCGRHDG